MTWTCELATKIMLFDTSRLFYMGVSEVTITQIPQETNICVINGIHAEMLEKELESWTHRITHLKASCEQHLHEIMS